MAPAPNTLASHSISDDSIAERLGLSDVPAIVDVRIDDDFVLDHRLIPASRRRPHAQCASWAADHAGRELVVVCQRGLKLSEGVAAMLRNRGVSARNLVGGFEAWRTGGHPTLIAERLRMPADGGAARSGSVVRPAASRRCSPGSVWRALDFDAWRQWFAAPTGVRKWWRRPRD